MSKTFPRNMHFCTLRGGFDEWMDRDLLMFAFDVCYWCCTSVLLVDVRTSRINHFCLKLVSRISHKWYFYLLTISAYILKVIYSFQLFICYCMNVWVTIWHFCTVEPFIYFRYMNNLLCDMLFTTILPNFLWKVVYLNWFLFLW